MIKIYYNNWFSYINNLSFFVMNAKIIYTNQISFLDEELYEYIIEPKIILYYI